MSDGRARGIAPAAFATSCLVAAQLVGLRIFFHADRERVWLLDTPLKASCAFNEHVHLPCPACGISRGVVLAVHGQLHQSFELFPAAPLLLFGLVLLALAMVLLAWCELLGVNLRRAARPLRAGAIVYVLVVALVWAGGYGAHLSAALSPRSPVAALPR